MMFDMQSVEELVPTAHRPHRVDLQVERDRGECNRQCFVLANRGMIQLAVSLPALKSSSLPANKEQIPIPLVREHTSGSQPIRDPLQL